MTELGGLAARTGLIAGLLLLALGLPVPARAGEQQLVLDPKATKVAFTLAATLHTVEGRVPLSKGTIRFDTATGVASGEIVLDARGAGTGNSLRDDNMHVEVLESEHFPRIVFQPTRLEVVERSATSADVKLHGELQMHGVSRPLVVSAHLEKVGAGDERIAITAHVPVRYIDWGMKNISNFVLRVADQVDVQVAAEGTLHGP
jgi:polyisoprenoid-binding protein YceI